MALDEQALVVPSGFAVASKRIAGGAVELLAIDREIGQEIVRGRMNFRAWRHQDAESDVMAFAILEGFLQRVAQDKSILGMDQVQEGACGQLVDGAADEALQGGGGGDPVEVGGEVRDHAQPAAALHLPVGQRVGSSGVGQAQVAQTFQLFAGLDDLGQGVLVGRRQGIQLPQERAGTFLEDLRLGTIVEQPGLGVAAQGPGVLFQQPQQPPLASDGQHEDSASPPVIRTKAAKSARRNETDRPCPARSVRSGSGASTGRSRRARRRTGWPRCLLRPARHQLPRMGVPILSWLRDRHPGFNHTRNPSTRTRPRPGFSVSATIPGPTGVRVFETRHPLASSKVGNMPQRRDLLMPPPGRLTNYPRKKNPAKRL